MAYRITEDCVRCGACFDECPSGAISKGKTQYIIDPEKCTECGSCAMIYCPTGAIVSLDS